MNKLNLNNLISLDNLQQIKTLFQVNKYLEKLSAEERICWAFEYLEKQLVLSSSFGIQSTVTLHLITRQYPNIPIILIDTGYLFPETYRFIDQLVKELKLNLFIFRADKSPAWQEAIYGNLWEKGLEGLKLYNKINKVEPMQCALKSLHAGTWFAGLRRTQSDSRSDLPVLFIQYNIFKFFPIIDWNNNQIYQYIKKHDLSFHPLWGKGYLSVGDIHTTCKWESWMNKEEETRFFGLKRECGLHENK